jgi:hypothetical protein
LVSVVSVIESPAVFEACAEAARQAPFSRRRASGSSRAGSFHRGDRGVRRAPLERRRAPAYRDASPLAEATRRQENTMHPSASPRHPWKALAVVIAMSAVVHGVWSHDVRHWHGGRHVHIVDFSHGDIDRADINVYLDAGGPDDGPAIAVFDGDDWS